MPGKAGWDPPRPRDAGWTGPDERVRTVGAVSGAELLGITTNRFARLARAGCFRPTRWYVNRYRAVVWLYPADEVTAFAEEHPGWLAGRLPEEVRARLAEGIDLRAPGWRLRRAAHLASRAPDALHEAAIWLALLGPDSAGGLLDDDDRARLATIRAEPLSGRPPAPDRPTDVSPTADDPAEIAYARAALAAALDRARAALPVPAPNACGRTVTRHGQRRRWPLSLFSRRHRARHGTGRGRGGPGRTPARAARPDQSKGRR